MFSRETPSAAPAALRHSTYPSHIHHCFIGLPRRSKFCSFLSLKMICVLAGNFFHAAPYATLSSLQTGRLLPDCTWISTPVSEIEHGWRMDVIYLRNLCQQNRLLWLQYVLKSRVTIITIKYVEYVLIIWARHIKTQQQNNCIWTEHMTLEHKTSHK